MLSFRETESHQIDPQTTATVAGDAHIDEEPQVDPTLILLNEADRTSGTRVVYYSGSHRF